MPYSGNTFLSLRGQLAERLNDIGKVFTTDAELKLHIQDAIRFWNILTGDNKINYPLQINAGQVWYDLQTIGLLGTLITSNGGTSRVKYRFRLTNAGNPANHYQGTATVFNQGNTTVTWVISDTLGNILASGTPIPPGTLANVFVSATGLGGTINLAFATANVGDSLNIIACNCSSLEVETGVNQIQSLGGQQFITLWLPVAGAATNATLNTLATSSSPQFCTLAEGDVYTRITYALLEPPSATAQVLTAQFATDEIIQSLQRKRDEFIFRTGCRSTVETLPVTANVPTISLPGTVIQVRRGYWLPVDQVAPTPLYKTDEYAISAFQPFAPGTPSQPLGYSVTMRPPLQVELTPPSQVDGNAEFITHESQAALPIPIPPGFLPTPLLIPNDFVPGLTWGAVADLFNFNLLGKDIPRANIAAQRFEELVSLMQVYPFVFGARVNNAAIMTDAVENLDIYQPDWRASTANPPFVAISGNNLVAYPSNAGATIILLMLANANIPINDNDAVQLGDEVLDVILDEAQATASFKMVSDVAVSAHQLHGNIIRLAAKRNAKVRAMACFRDVLYGRTQREDQMAPMEVAYDDNQ